MLNKSDNTASLLDNGYSAIVNKEMLDIDKLQEDKLNMKFNN